MNVFYFPLVKPLSHVGTDGIVLLALQIAVCCQLHQPQPHQPQHQPRSHNQQQPLQIKFVMMLTSTFSMMRAGILTLAMLNIVIIMDPDSRARTGKDLVI